MHKKDVTKWQVGIATFRKVIVKAQGNSLMEAEVPPGPEAPERYKTSDAEANLKCFSISW